MTSFDLFQTKISLSDDTTRVYPTLNPPGGKVGENTNFASFDIMDFKIQALLGRNFVIEKLTKKSQFINIHPFTPNNLNFQGK